MLNWYYLNTLFLLQVAWVVIFLPVAWVVIVLTGDEPTVMIQLGILLMQSSQAYSTEKGVGRNGPGTPCALELAPFCTYQAGHTSANRDVHTVCTTVHTVHTGCTPAERLLWTKNTCLSFSLVDSLVQAACIARIIILLY
jgi:hypothetical protein